MRRLLVRLFMELKKRNQNCGSVLFTTHGNPILFYSPKFSKNPYFLYSNQNLIISYSVDLTTFYVLHTYFLPLFISYTLILYQLLHYIINIITTFYIKYYFFHTILLLNLNIFTIFYINYFLIFWTPLTFTKNFGLVR